MLWDKDVTLDDKLPPRDLAAFRKLEDGVFLPGSQLGAERAKIIPYLAAGAPWPLDKLVNNQCGQLSAALEVTQHTGEGYAEIDIDLGGFKSGSVFFQAGQAPHGPRLPHPFQNDC